MTRPNPCRTPLQILVADDSPVSQRLVVSLLEAMGHRVTIAENGVLAYEAASKHTYDVIFMDVDMPEMNGLEATRLIRQQERPGVHTPIIAVTSNTDRQACLEAGMDEFLSKASFWGHLDRVLARISQSSAA